MFLSFFFSLSLTFSEITMDFSPLDDLFNLCLTPKLCFFWNHFPYKQTGFCGKILETQVVFITLKRGRVEFMGRSPRQRELLASKMAMPPSVKTLRIRTTTDGVTPHQDRGLRKSVLFVGKNIIFLTLWIDEWLRLVENWKDMRRIWRLGIRNLNQILEELQGQKPGTRISLSNYP